MFTRRLFASSSPSGLLFTFVHEHPSVPIILVVDAPQSAPGYSTTPFGRLYSSLLDPAPTAAIVDGIGVFGPADPQMLTALDGTWTRMFTFPPQAQSWVAQIVSYDQAYAYPATYGLSNAAEFTH